jgi:hypothetical protein
MTTPRQARLTVIRRQRRAVQILRKCLMTKSRPELRYWIKELGGDCVFWNQKSLVQKIIDLMKKRYLEDMGIEVCH